jgi:hypothetical protein
LVDGVISSFAVVIGNWVIRKNGIQDSGRKKPQQTAGTKKHRKKSPYVPLL